ncbi:GOLPH3/VPS74 family protein [Streptomyces zhihengii]|uniref:GPP34 family phosphoprotein n=1 Tax=Streptomyces zhihengii TaxID=1818004 RepID=A0ABS2UJ59_9ACTN|nr:GPP34 family phosphoprotein [Streptomyces zhihengii]MBM9617294.1 GPP34 family phosphoprotein [Streptomyces zhihengii]
MTAANTTTAKDLFIIAMDTGPDHAVGQGDLSLALAGAELIDLLGSGSVTVDGDRVVPGQAPAPDDRLLREAAALLTRQPPYEPVEDWLWRRGRELAAAYRDALEAEGGLTRAGGDRSLFGTRRVEPADTPARRRATERRAEGEPVLTALGAAVGIDDGESAGADADEAGGGEAGLLPPALGDESVTAVVAAVHDAVMELEAVRQRRTIENAAFANVWRGP